MKKILILSVLAFFGFAAHAIAAEGFTALAPITGLTDSGATSVVDSDSLANFFNNLYKYLIGLAATLAVIEIIWGGLEYSTQDSVSKQSNGRERITQAIFGLILVLSPVLVFSIINPSILNLSLNLPALDTKGGPAPETTPSSGTGSADTARTEGCSASLNQGDVSCPTQEAANTFAASCTNGPGRVFMTNQTSLPFGASCNPLQPFQGGRNYTDKTLIPIGSWCYTTTLNKNDVAVINYVCQTDKDSCENLIINRPGEGTYRAGCTKY